MSLKKIERNLLCLSFLERRKKLRITFNLHPEGAMKLKSLLSTKCFCHTVLEGTTEVLSTIYFSFDLMLLIKKLIKLS